MVPHLLVDAQFTGLCPRYVIVVPRCAALCRVVPRYEIVKQSLLNRSVVVQNPEMQKRAILGRNVKPETAAPSQAPQGARG